MFDWSGLTGKWLWWAFIIVALSWFSIGATGCSIASWDAQATEGRHKTTWNHGLEISVTGWGIYIGPGRNSTTTIDNEFAATAEGTGHEPDQVKTTDED